MNDFEADNLSLSSEPCLPDVTLYLFDDFEEPSFGPKLKQVSTEGISRFQIDLPEVPSQEEKKEESLGISFSSKSELRLSIFSPKKNPEAFICVICLEDILEREETAELSCRHRFCRSCVTRHVEAKIEANSFPVTCLYQNCGHDLTGDLKGIISSDLNDRLLDRQFKSCVGALPNMKHCLTPDCPGAFEVDDGVEILDCPLCSSKYCLKCSRKAHEGLLCSEVIEEGKEGEEVQAYLKDNRCRQCPQCKFWVERSTGCNHMTCRCKFQFCYQCGQKWTGIHRCGVYENARGPELPVRNRGPQANSGNRITFRADQSPYQPRRRRQNRRRAVIRRPQPPPQPQYFEVPSSFRPEEAVRSEHRPRRRSSVSSRLYQGPIVKPKSKRDIITEMYFEMRNGKDISAKEVEKRLRRG